EGRLARATRCPAVATRRPAAATRPNGTPRAYHRQHAEPRRVALSKPGRRPGRIDIMTTESAPPPVERAPAGDPGAHRLGRGPACVIGIVAVGITLAGAELLARAAMWIGLTGTASSPFGSLGAAFIAITPEWLKDAAIGLFGQHDKPALAVSMGLVGLAAGAGIGLVGRASERLALTLAAALVVVAGIAIATRPGAGIPDLVPLLAGAVAGLSYLHAALRPWDDDILGWGAPPT